MRGSEGEEREEESDGARERELRRRARMAKTVEQIAHAEPMRVPRRPSGSVDCTTFFTSRSTVSGSPFSGRRRAPFSMVLSHTGIAGSPSM